MVTLRRVVRRAEVETLRLLRFDRPALVVVLKGTFASAAAFEFARHTVGSQVPALAAMAAIITVQVSGSQTVRRALEYSVGVASGVIAASFLTRLLGVHWWSIGLLVLLSLLAGRLIRLGSQANQIAISALLVMSLGTSYGWTRFVDTLIGCAVGVVTSLAVPAPSLERALRRQVAAAAAELSIAIRSMSVGIRDQGSPAEMGEGLGAARAVSRLLVDPRASVETARDEGRSLLTRRPSEATQPLDRCDAAVTALDHATNEVRSVGRSLLTMSADGWSVGGPDRSAVSTVLEAVARAVEAWQIAVAADNPIEQVDRLRDELRQAKAKRVSVQGGERPGTWGAPWVAVFLDIERITGELDPNGAHAAAVAC